MLLRYNNDTKSLTILKASTLEYSQLKLSLNRHVKNFKYMPSFKRGIWDGKVNHFKSDTDIPVGLWKEIAIAMDKVHSGIKLENRKDFPLNRDITLEKVQKFCDDFFKDHYIDDEGERVKFFPYDHQIDTAYKVLKNRYCTAEVATGGGKSLIIFIVFMYILKHIKEDATLLLIVPSISLVTQFYDDIMDYNLGFNKENKNPLDLRIQEIMSDKPRKWHEEGEPNIYISTFQSLANVKNFPKEFYKQFYGVVCDEAHMAKSDSFNKIMKRTLPNAYYQFGVSGTFQDDGFAEFLTIQSLTGPKVAKIKAKELQDKGIISYVRISQIHLNHDDYDFRDKLKEIRKGPNSGAQAYRLEGDYIRSSDKRKEFIYKLTQQINTNTLILFNIIEYGNSLLEYLESKYEGNDNIIFYLINGSIKKKDREEIKKNMELDDGKIRILLATFGTLSTGVSIKNLHNIIFAEGFKAETRIIQSIGRSLRLFESKKIASIYDLVDTYSEEKSNNILLRHGKDRLDMYEKHEYPYKVKKFTL